MASRHFVFDIARAHVRKDNQVSWNSIHRNQQQFGHQFGHPNNKKMEDFDPQLGHLAVITSRGSDTTLLTQALVIIHNDLILHKGVAAREYCSNDLMESLIYLTRSSNNQLIRILATSLLNSICTCGDLYVERFDKLNGPINLLAMLLPRDNTGKEEMMNHTLMNHEQAMKMLVLLSAKEKNVNSLVNFGLVDRMVELCNIFSSDSPHRNCCFDKVAFSEEACVVTRNFIEGKKLVGKIDEEESGAKGQLHMYAVDLYDTTTDEDIHINKELLKLGYAWPDPFLLPGENQKKPSDETVWMDFQITKVIDAHCFWAFIDKDATNKIQKLSRVIEDYIYSSDVCPLVDLSVGDKVCFSLTKENNSHQWLRGCVLAVDDVEKKAHILLVDYGYGVRVDIDQLFPLTEDVGDVPHQASLCVLKGVQAAPPNPSILKYICEIITNLTQESHRIRIQLHNLGVTKFLIRYCMLPEKEIVIKAVAALINILNNFKIRAEIGQAGACRIAYELLSKHSDDNYMLDGILGLILNLIVECYPNRKILVEFDTFLLLMKIYRSPKIDSGNKEIIVNILKNLVGNGWRLLDPVNVPDVRGIIQESVDRMQGSFNLPNLCGDDLLEEVKKRRTRRRELRSCEADPDPRYVSLTADDLARKLTVSSDGEDSKSEGYKTDTDFEDNFEQDSLMVNDIADGYMYGTRANIAEDDKHCFMHAQSAGKIKDVEIGNTVCAMLNNGCGGTVYIGITKSGQVLGMNISRKERDDLRLGVDDHLGRFLPSVKHDKYEIKCLPVLNPHTCKQVEERYIIELRIARSSYQFFQTPSKKLFFRDGRNNTELNVQQIREKTIREEEEKYQAEIRSLRQALEIARNRLKEKPIYDPDLD